MILNRIKKEQNSSTMNLIKVLISAVFASSILIGSGQANSNTTKVKLSLSTDSERFVVSPRTVAKIIPGESKLDAEARLANEEKLKAELAKRNREVISRGTRTATTAVVNVDADAVYRAAGAAYGIDPRAVKAVHILETGGDVVSFAVNPSGAGGPFQFIPSTWRSVGVDANGDGQADRFNFHDAAYSAAKYLALCGGQTDMAKAFYGYNPSKRYVQRALNLMASLPAM